MYGYLIFLQMLYGKCSQMIKLYCLHVIDNIKKHTSFKTGSIFKTYYILKIT